MWVRFAINSEHYTIEVISKSLKVEDVQHVFLKIGKYDGDYSKKVTQEILDVSPFRFFSPDDEGTVLPPQYYNPLHGLEIFKVSSQLRKDVTCENGILFLIELILLKKLKNELCNELIKKLSILLPRLRTTWQGEVVEGHYDRYADDSKLGDKLGDRTKISLQSHDNITAIVVASNILGNDEVKKLIWGRFKQSLFRLDNQFPYQPRWTTIQHPRDVFYYGIHGGSKIAWLLYPIFLGAIIATTLNPKDICSGRLLWFVRLWGTDKLKLTRKLYSYIMRKQYGEEWISKIMDIYFLDRDMPCRVEAKGVKL